jgi:isoleucyl-tRNA synthetase
VDGQVVELKPEEVLVQTHPAEGLAVAADKQATVAVEAQVTPELRAEGLAREVVRRVQAMRKDASFEIADRITTYYQAQGDLAEVFQTWAEYIQAETLSTELVPGSAPEGAYQETQNVDGQVLVLAVKRN